MTGKLGKNAVASIKECFTFNDSPPGADAADKEWWLKTTELRNELNNIPKKKHCIFHMLKIFKKGGDKDNKNPEGAPFEEPGAE